MKIRAQIGMVLNLDKCIGCHTCSVTCKQVWTNRDGVEYAWFNNVESKPGLGFPGQWENQEIWRGGWRRKSRGGMKPAAGGKWRILANIFANPNLPVMEDYYTPYDFDYASLQANVPTQHVATARPYSRVTGETLDKVHGGPNWEDSLASEFSVRSKDYNFRGMEAEKDIYGKYENSFLMFLPRLCEHCLNPACVASCPSGAIYKREEDGIVLIDQEKCRGWRMCVSGCPYKKIYFNWHSGKSEKCIFCYPRIEAGEPTVCSETCVGRIRYLGVMLYDADKIRETAQTPDVQDAYPAQSEIFLNPHDPEVIAQAVRDGVPESWLRAARKSPVYKMIEEWKIAFPLHPEYRTLPMVWYIPPLSPIQEAAENGSLATVDGVPDVSRLRIPVQYLANLLTAGDEKPVRKALKRMLALRAWKRRQQTHGENDPALLEGCGMDAEQMEEMYRLLAIANYEDRFVVPTAPKAQHENAYRARGVAGLNFSQTSPGRSRFGLWGQPAALPAVRRHGQEG